MCIFKILLRFKLTIAQLFLITKWSQRWQMKGISCTHIYTFTLLCVYLQNVKFHIKNVKLHMKKVDWAQRAHCAHGHANMHACQNMKFHFENMKFHVKKSLGPKGPW